MVVVQEEEEEVVVYRFSKAFTKSLIIIPSLGII